MAARNARFQPSVHRADRTWLYGGNAAVVDPVAGSQLGQHRVPGRLDLAGRQQGAEEQVTVGGQALAQSCLVMKQGRGIGQLIHTPTVSSGRYCCGSGLAIQWSPRFSNLSFSAEYAARSA